MVVETLFHSINRRHGSFGRGKRTVSPMYHDGWFLLIGQYLSKLASDRRKNTESEIRMHK
jgi:hypothetical protein